MEVDSPSRTCCRRYHYDHTSFTHHIFQGYPPRASVYFWMTCLLFPCVCDSPHTRSSACYKMLVPTLLRQGKLPRKPNLVHIYLSLCILTLSPPVRRLVFMHPHSSYYIWWTPCGKARKMDWHFGSGVASTNDLHTSRESMGKVIATYIYKSLNCFWWLIVGRKK